MAVKTSAGILMYRLKNKKPEFLLVHPGGPFWKNKDAGVWSIPKGEFEKDEDPLTAAIREVKEETGIDVKGAFTELQPCKLKSGKIVYAWAVEQDADITTITSNEFDFEWPPKSGKTIRIPEVDKAGWFDYTTACEKINPGQTGFLEEMSAKLQ